MNRWVAHQGSNRGRCAAQKSTISMIGAGFSGGYQRMYHRHLSLVAARGRQSRKSTLYLLNCAGVDGSPWRRQCGSDRLKVIMCPDICESLPVHSVGKVVSPYVLVVDGLVARPVQLSRSDLDGLPQHDLTDDFTCLEGWTVPALKWNGVALQTVLSLVRATAEAQWIQASAGAFSVPLAVHDAGRALLATHLGGQDLPIEHGGPVRLVVPGADCFTSVKWLNHLEFRAEPGANTGREIALRRLCASRTSGS